jgi:hypothetical protein
MTDDAEDKIKRAFVRLSSIRSNTPQTFETDEALVQEYSAALLHLEQLGYDVEEFKIPSDWLYHPWVSKDPVNGVQYAERRVVKRALFMTKLDAVLGYFTSLATREKIGFAKTG